MQILFLASALTGVKDSSLFCTLRRENRTDYYVRFKSLWDWDLMSVSLLLIKSSGIYIEMFLWQIKRPVFFKLLIINDNYIRTKIFCLMSKIWKLCHVYLDTITLVHPYHLRELNKNNMTKWVMWLLGIAIKFFPMLMISMRVFSYFLSFIS